MCLYCRAGRAGEEGFQVTSTRSSSSNVTNKGQAKVTTMLLVVSFAWLVLTTPFAVCGIIFAVGEVDRQLAGLLMPVKAVSFLLMYVNHAVNFYLYCLTGRKFRRELVDVMIACRCAVTGRLSQQSTMTTGNGMAARGMSITSRMRRSPMARRLASNRSHE